MRKVTDEINKKIQRVKTWFTFVIQLSHPFRLSNVLIIDISSITPATTKVIEP
jgi:hypothetical protein